MDVQMSCWFEEYPRGPIPCASRNIQCLPGQFGGHHILKVLITFVEVEYSRDLEIFIRSNLLDAHKSLASYQSPLSLRKVFLSTFFVLEVPLIDERWWEGGSKIHHEKHTWFVASSSTRLQQYGWTDRTTKRKGNGILHRGIYNGEEFQQSQRVRAWSKTRWEVWGNLEYASGGEETT